jgi:hypothetical protein
LKNQAKIFLELSVSLENKTCLKGTVARDFLPPIVFHESTEFHGQKYAERCGSEALEFRKNYDCGIAVAEQHFFKSCGTAIAEVLPSSWGIAIADSKIIARAHLCLLTVG